jgi:hypothetical protein
LEEFCSGKEEEISSSAAPCGLDNMLKIFIAKLSFNTTGEE